MAEAHQGVAFSFTVTEDEGLHLNVSYEALKAVLLSGARNWRKKLWRFMNSVLNGLYPSHPTRGLLVIGGITCIYVYKRKDLSFGLIGQVVDKIPRSLMKQNTAEIVTCVGYSTGLWLTLVTFRKYTLKSLFSYQGWMYEVHGKTSVKSKLWMILLKTLVRRKPQLYSYQNSLPYLPLPPLEDTVARYLRSVRPLLDDDNYNRLAMSANEFKSNIGKRLQRYLRVKSWISSNYVSDWWEEYVYLRGRSPIMVNSNYYGLDTLYPPPTSVQAARAANFIHAAFLYRRDLDNEQLQPLMVQSLIPLCSRQYERQFNTTRVPGETTDKLVHFNDSKHIAVYANGKWYKLYTYHQSKLLNPKEIEVQLMKILEDKSEAASWGETHLGAFTAGDRIPWAQARTKYFSSGVNKRSLSAIEQAAFVVILDSDEHNATPGVDLNKYARSALHGKGFDRWFDKSFSLVFSRNAKVAVNSEHSWADAPITGHLMEHITHYDRTKLGYDSAGYTQGTPRFESLPDPIRLKWQFNDDCLKVLQESERVSSSLVNDVDLHVYAHQLFGKRIMKKAKISPDAFIQMSLQLAYFRDIGRHHLTYESSMTRLFREGRTETVRSCSIESCDWVKAMCDDQVSVQQRAQLFRVACEHHQQQYRDAMTGKGIDRHLFCLYVVSKYLEIDSPFLQEVLSEPWRLSTSQTPPNQTVNIDYTNHPEFISVGGGFGPVADDGYGVSYIIAGEDMIFFHISSKKSSEKTDSSRFGEQIKQALIDVKELLEQEKAFKKALES